MSDTPEVAAAPGAALPADHPIHRLGDSLYLRAARCRRTSQVPVWFQRQAGRSLPEYRALRGPGSILDAIADPPTAAEITLQPVRRYGVDAAVLFSDIVVPAAAVGFGIDVVPGVGPVAGNPLRSRDDLDRLPPLDAEAHTPYVLETVRLLTAELDVPLVGFAGAPFTVASYLVEGAPSRQHLRTKSLMHADTALWHDLMERLASIAVASMRSQVLAGASATQLFDSWAGTLSPADYAEFVAPHSKRVFDDLADLGVPRAHFGVGTGELLDQMAGVGADVVGVDWRVPLEVARERVGPGVALQGNLDPALCVAGWDAVRPAADRILAEGTQEPGYIFNLGHGVLPETDPAVLERLTDHVHAYRRPVPTQLAPSQHD
ncbi:uroporphyrinogen decarboxylase [Candidatus Poriferisodalis sp.]|uniref:uroporphyrinogen decarboxylase n=1 Tax=Candidatus Poriferisodalis sp. TaxID=3101277 RepID=UPI003B015B3A